MSVKQPLVSVIIPCLNRAHFLVPTIESILQQDYPHIECIVVDGGSRDRTVEILKEYGRRIKWISEPDECQADAINKGWRMSKGDILAWLNADDVWAVPDAVGQAVAYLQGNPEADVVYGDCGGIDAEGKLTDMAYLHEWDLEYAIESCDHCIPQPAAFIRRRVIEKVGWLDTSLLLMDWDLWCRIGLAGRIEYLPALLAYARRTPSYWRGQGHIAAENCVRITRRFFHFKDIPQRIRRKKRRAISNAYLRGTDYAFANGRHWRTVFIYALHAMIADPANALNALGRLRNHVARGAAEDGRLRWTLLVLELMRLPLTIMRKTRYWVWNLGRFRAPTLSGDRDIEWSWIASQMPSGPGEALDFGSGGSNLGLIAAQKGLTVTAIDLEVAEWTYSHPRLRFLQGDLLKLPLPKEHFDVVINCSTVEHVGLAGRYGVEKDLPDGDLEAMENLHKIMKPGSTMLLTVPVGRDAVFMPLHRVYGEKRLPHLLKGFRIKKEEYWVKDGVHEWILTSKEDALGRTPQERLYGLGCFVLERLRV